MALLQRWQALNKRRAMAGLLSAMLHLGLAALIILSGGPADGTHEDAMPASQWVWLDTPAEVRRDPVNQSPGEPAMAESIRAEQPDLPSIEPPTVPRPGVEIPHFAADESRLVDLPTVEAPDGSRPSADVSAPTFVIPQGQASELLHQVERLAEALVTTPRARVTWQQDGRHYEAKLVREPARDGVEPERAIAEIATEEQGRQLRTWISLKRLPFSHYAKLIDRWDPMVQLHDDEIVGRMHINSRFNVLYDSQAAPRVFGQVTTAAAGFNLESRGRRRESEVFSESIETGVGPISFSDLGWSFAGAEHRADAHTHELADDTRIRFLADGGYSWREGRSGVWQYASPPAGQPVYFIASRSAAVHVKGVVSGQFLVYSPRRIVVEGDLTYARDPRRDTGSDDYLGLVSDRDIEVAPPHVTGPGDLHIQAALFARRRIVVSDASRPGTATLHIFGSLAAGTLSESEPRYAARVEYDRRFDRQRPPGFPSTNRFATEDWDRQWTEIPEHRIDAGF